MTTHLQSRSPLGAFPTRAVACAAALAAAGMLASTPPAHGQPAHGQGVIIVPRIEGGRQPTLPGIAPAAGEPDANEPEAVPVPRALPDEQEVAGVVVDADVRRLAEQLADPSFEQRELAQQRLLGGDVDVRQLCALLTDPDLTSEQRYRLLQVLQVRLRGAPRGAVGIRMMWQRPENGHPGEVIVTDLLEGLPAGEVLQLRDRISKVDGRPLFHQSDLIVLVQSKLPGETVTLTVTRSKRDGNGDLIIDEEGRVAMVTMDVELRLGSTELLRDPETGQASQPGAVEVERAREARLAEWRYGPKPCPVEIRGAEGSDFVITNPQAWKVDEEVEQHPIIQAILLDKKMIEHGETPFTAQIRAAWAQRLVSLRQQAESPGLAPDEADLLRRVADRFEELMEERE